MNLSVWIRKAFVAQEALYQGTGFSRAEQSDEERGLCGLGKGSVAKKPLDTDWLRHD